MDRIEFVNQVQKCALVVAQLVQGDATVLSKQIGLKLSQS